jgi:TRAP-type C4-dicarboxylate transport system permease small subunit
VVSGYLTDILLEIGPLDLPFMTGGLEEHRKAAQATGTWRAPTASAGCISRSKPSAVDPHTRRNHQGSGTLIARLAGVAALLAGFATLAIVLLISYDVAMRYFFDRPQIFVDEVASFLEVLVVFGGAAYTYRVGGHVRVDLLTGRLRPSGRAWLRVFTLVLGIAFLAGVVWVTTQSGITAWRYGRVSAVMLYPLWLPMFHIPAGLVLMTLAMLVTLAR